MYQILILFVIYSWGHTLVLFFDNKEWEDKTWYQKLITLIWIMTFWLAVLIWLFVIYMIFK